MANPGNLEKAYSAIGSLLAKGNAKLTVERVSSESGIARQTFYQKDEDWKEVLAVIKGKPSSRVKLVQVEFEEKSKAVKKFEGLHKRLEVAEQELSRMEHVASTVYKELIDEVQRWFDKATDSPKNRNQVSKYIEELNRARDDIERLSAENRFLKAERAAGEIKPLTMKKVIRLPALHQQVEVIELFLSQLEALLPNAQIAETVSAVYLLCGLPFSGKTTWIEKHEPHSPGTHLYIDCCNSHADLRRFQIKRLRSSIKAPIHCVWIRTSAELCTDRVGGAKEGATGVESQNLIKKVDKIFQPPALNEPFNSIILV